MQRRGSRFFLIGGGGWRRTTASVAIDEQEQLAVGNEQFENDCHQFLRGILDIVDSLYLHDLMNSWLGCKNA